MPKCPRRKECASFTFDPYNGECVFNSCLESAEKPYRRYRRFVRKPVSQKTLADELTEAKAEIENLRSLAENWQLVLGMRPDTRLGRTHYGYYCEEWDSTSTRWETLPEPFVRHDPAEALRSIQQKDTEK